jgi:subtilisin family serine protease
MPGLPNDPRFREQWALQNLGGSASLFGLDIQVMNVWKRTTGSAALTIAVIDSGIDFTHPDLRNQQWHNRKEREDKQDNDRNGFADDVGGWPHHTRSRVNAAAARKASLNCC